MLKKVYSIIIAFFIVMSILVSLPIETSAVDVEIARNGKEIEFMNTGVWNPYTNVYQDVDGDGYREIPCTYVAWQKAYEICGVELPSWSHANTWYSSAQSAGIPTGTEPRVNSIACFSSGYYGHVSFVTAVNNDNTMNVIEGGRYDLDRTASQGVGTSRPSSIVGVGGLQGFIYLSNPGPSFTPVYMGEHFYANIINPSSGKAVVATGDNAGSNVVLQSLDGILLHKWEFIHLGNNAYKIVNNHSGKVLDVNAGSNVTGTNVQVWDSLDNIAQKWYFKAVGNGYSLVPECAPNLCLDIYNGYTANGTNIQICTENNSNAQIFTLNILPSFVAQNLGEHFYANIIHKQSGKAVVAVGDNTGDNVELKTLDGVLLHKWEFIRQSDWSYLIVNNHSGKALDVNGCSDANNTNVQVWDSVGSIAQLWYFREAANGGYSLVPKCALNSALDLRSGNTSEGANIEIYAYQDSSTPNHSNQTFSLNYTPSFVAQNLGEHFYANIVHLDSDKPIVAVGDNDADNVELGEFSGAIIKKWEFIRQNDWSYIIINNHSGKALDVNCGYTENGTNIQVCESNNSNAQRWYIKQLDSGYSLVPKCALNSALDLEEGKTETGTNISLHKQNSTAAQSYYFNYQPADIALDMGESFDAFLIHKESGYAVSYNGVGNAIVQPNEATTNQLWHFERQDDVSYIIACWNTEFSMELTLEVEKNFTSDGSNVQVGESTGTNSQKWFIIKNGDGYALIPKCAVNRALDLDKGIYQENSDLNIYNLEKGNTNQVFKLLKHETPIVNPTEPSGIILGDVDGDSDVEIRDSTWIQRHVTKEEMPFVINKTTADVDGDGIITVMDATAIQYYLANMKTSYKIGEKIE